MFPSNITPQKFLRPWYFAGRVVETVGWTRHTAILQSDIAPLAPSTTMVPVMIGGVVMTLPLSQLDV
jgi:hypothetical protein